MLRTLVPPYEYGEPCPPDDDLSDVIPSAKFHAEFPDGIVPIRFTEHLPRTADEGHVQVLDDMLTLFEGARAILGDWQDIDDVRHEYGLLEQRQYPERRAIIHRLMAKGIPMRRIAAMLDVSCAEVADTVCVKVGRFKITSENITDEIMRVSDLVVEGSMSPLEIAEVTGGSTQRVMHVWDLHHGDEGTIEEALAHAYWLHFKHGYGRTEAWREACNRFPKMKFSKQWVYGVTRKQYQSRNAQRFAAWEQEVAA